MALPRRLITQTNGVKTIVGCKASELGLEAGPLESISSLRKLLVILNAMFRNQTSWQQPSGLIPAA